MLHHSLIPPFLSSSSSSSSPPNSHLSFNEVVEASMEVTLKASSWPETVSQHEEAAWAVERSGILGDEFSVDDLLDFGGLTDIEEDEAEQEEEEARPNSSSPSSSSALSFEPAPPSEIALPADDVAELEWVSHFVDESFSDFPPPCPAASPFVPGAGAAKPRGEPAATAKRAAACVLSTEAPVPVKAKRSKRSRAPGWVRSMPGAAPRREASSSISSSSSSSSSSSCVVVLWAGQVAPEKPKKKRGRKPKQQPPPRAAAGGATGERRCSHCGSQKTPQWRTGPEGAKTLCNACGVRFKSGRLFPEYRPAFSPSFLSHAHSNSHRKVLEMRRKKAEFGLLPPSAAVSSPGSAVHFGLPGRP